MSELLDLAREIVERASPDHQVEAYVTHSKTFEARAHGGEIDSLSSAEPRGAGVRVVAGGRTGFAYTTDLSARGLNEVVEAAGRNSENAGVDDAAGLPERWMEEPQEIEGLWDSKQPGTGPDAKVAYVLELERAAETRDRRVRAVEDAVYADAATEVAIETSTGIGGAYRRTDAWSYVSVIVEQDEDTEVGFEFGLGRALDALDPEAIAASAADRGLRLLGASKIASARMPVVLEPFVAGQFLSVLGAALTGEAVHKGRSLFAGRIGEQVAAGELTLVDDGRLAGAPGAAPWDDEGVPTQRTEIISHGILNALLYDTKSARRDGTRSTGNAARSGFKTVPAPAPSNLAFDTTGVGVAEVMTRAGRGLLVQDLHGLHSGANPVSGDFSVGATGLLLEDGEPGRPVKEVTIAAPMLEILRGIVAVASDRRWLPFGGSYGGATTLVGEMTVAGE